MEEPNIHSMQLLYSRLIPAEHAERQVAVQFSKEIYPLIADGETYAITILTDNTDREYVYKKVSITKVIKTYPVKRWVPVSWRRRLSILFNILFKGGYYDYF